LYPDITETKQHLFDSGHEVGLLAQAYFKNGIEITEEYYEIDKAIASTVHAVNQGYQAIFEATACSADGAFSRIDILKKVAGSEKWDLIEVKQSNGVKDYHIDDMALQRYAFEGAGYNVRKTILMHVNNQYVRKGDIDPKGFFALEDCTEIVESRLPDVPGFLAGLLEVLNTGTEPCVEIGDH
jgi:tetrahydromethanopterin S-methyltransferase subunit H